MGGTTFVGSGSNMDDTEVVPPEEARDRGWIHFLMKFIQFFAVFPIWHFGLHIVIKLFNQNSLITIGFPT